MPAKLYYWGIKARGQLSVIIGQFGGDDFAWEQKPDWPAMKDETLFGQLPHLADGDIKVSQSNAIVRYLARKYNLQGETDADFALSESLIEEQGDLVNLLVKANYGGNKEEDYNKVFAEEYPKHLANLEKLLSNDFFTSKVTAGSLAIFSALNIALDLEASLLDKTPKVKAFYDRVAALPQVKQYLDLGTEAYFKRT
mmetsp:Transcript_125385/g.187263  ORF Transcript_125385/g.187263 Transcript_125385/m.187263 type:complete len:197 (-) Transcript_125385:38-628(-)